MTDHTPTTKFEELDDNTVRLTITEPALDEFARKAIRGLHEQKEAALADALKAIGWTSPDDLPAHDRKIAAEALRGAAREMRGDGKRVLIDAEESADWLDNYADGFEQGGES